MTFADQVGLGWKGRTPDSPSHADLTRLTFADEGAVPGVLHAVDGIRHLALVPVRVEVEEDVHLAREARQSDLMTSYTRELEAFSVTQSITAAPETGLSFL